MKFSISTLSALLSACAVSSALPDPSVLLDRDFNPLPDDPSNGPVSAVDLPHDISTNCGGNTYAYTEVYDAMSWGIKLREKGIARGKKSSLFPNGRFPHSYTDDQFDFDARCPNDDNRQEYPLIFNGPYNGGASNNVQWGNDRAVYYHEPGEVGNDGHPLGYFCGTITHTGAPSQGQFVQCT